MDIRQTLKLTQQLVMTPQLQQAIKLLQMSRLELVETINEEMETNPALEESVEQEPSVDHEEASVKEKELIMDNITEDVSSINASENEINWEQYIESYSATDYQSRKFEHEEVPQYENIVRSQDSLPDHLRWQIQMSSFDERQRNIANFIAGNIDDDGYLKASLEEVAEALDCEVEDAEEVLKVIHAFDPLGIAARDLRECLLIQASFLNLDNTLVGEIIKNYLHDIEGRRLSKIAKETGSPLEEVVAAVKVISEFEPRPGRPFAEDNAQYITPDLYVYKVDDEYVIVQNEDGVPRLRISNYYKEAMQKDNDDDGAREYIQGKVRSAVWLIKSIQQRQRTIYKVMESILKFQRDFFDSGMECLKPLVLKDVADDIGMHESTISRVTNNKYVQTPHGIFELKFFFNSAISCYGAEDIASESVKEKIRQLLATENVKKPFSDQAIVELLKNSNINIARRTVTKYREMMGLASSSKRKKLF